MALTAGTANKPNPAGLSGAVFLELRNQLGKDLREQLEKATEGLKKPARKTTVDTALGAAEAGWEKLADAIGAAVVAHLTAGTSQNGSTTLTHPGGETTPPRWLEELATALTTWASSEPPQDLAALRAAIKGLAPPADLHGRLT